MKCEGTSRPDISFKIQQMMLDTCFWGDLADYYPTQSCIWQVFTLNNPIEWNLGVGRLFYKTYENYYIDN